MILVENQHINQIPVLHLAHKDLYHESLPFVIFEHGFTSAKEHNLHYAYLLAEKGFRVVLPEAAYHGERSTNLNVQQLALHFWEIVVQTIRELDIIREYLCNSTINRSFSNRFSGNFDGWYGYTWFIDTI